MVGLLTSSNSQCSEAQHTAHQALPAVLPLAWKTTEGRSLLVVLTHRSAAGTAVMRPSSSTDTSSDPEKRTVTALPGQVMSCVAEGRAAEAAPSAGDHVELQGCRGGASFAGRQLARRAQLA